METVKPQPPQRADLIFPNIPTEVLDAARTLSLWMEENLYNRSGWKLMGCASRMLVENLECRLTAAEEALRLEKAMPSQLLDVNLICEQRDEAVKERDKLKRELSAAEEAAALALSTLHLNESNSKKQETQLHQAHAENARLREALEFYANPESYHAVLVMGDPPTGGFDEDKDDVVYNGRRVQGAIARKALSSTQGKNPVVKEEEWLDEDITHWMPLPPPPTEGEKR